MNKLNTPTHDGWNHRWGCPPLSEKDMKKTFEKCTQCNGHLRVRINLDGTIETYGNHTTQYDGKFCSSSCAITYIEKIENNNKEKISLNNKYVNKNGNIKFQGEHTTSEDRTETKKEKEEN